MKTKVMVTDDIRAVTSVTAIAAIEATETAGIAIGTGTGGIGIGGTEIATAGRGATAIAIATGTETATGALPSPFPPACKAPAHLLDVTQGSTRSRRAVWAQPQQGARPLQAPGPQAGRAA